MISRRTAILASAVLAAGVFGATSSISFAQATGSQTPGHTNTTGAYGASNQNRSASDKADGQNEVKGVQDLFAKATEAAVKPNGEQELRALFAQFSDKGTNEATNRQREHAANSNTTGGIGTTSGGTSGLSARAPTGSNANSPGQSSAPGSNSTTGARNEAAGPNHMANQQALNQTIQQFQQDWKQKYGSNFTIQNPAMVFADISASDIMRGQAQTAGERIGGSTSPNGTSNNRATGSGTSPTGGIHANTGGATGGTAGANEQGRLGNLNANSTGSMTEQLTVDVPPVSGTQAVKISLVREGPSNFKFASENQMQMQQMEHMHLNSALEKHLKEVVDQKAQWPSDQQKAQRLVTQHVLMAISESQMGNMNESALPASSRIQGQSGHNTSPTPGGATK